MLLAQAGNAVAANEPAAGGIMDGGVPNWDAAVTALQEFAAKYGLQIIGAILIFFIGRLVAKIIRRIVERVLQKSRTDPTIVTFVGHMVYALLMIVVVIAAISKLGVQTASVVAMLGAAGLAVGLALQGSLANFAAGVLLIIFRPCRVDDFVEAGGATGTVKDIDMFTTRILTPDNRLVIVPNSKMTGDNIINFTAEGKRRIDMVIGIAYDADIDKAKGIVADILSKDERVMADPPVQVAVSELADSSVNLVVRPWVKAEDYWAVRFETMEAVKKQFDAAGVGIPFPQRDVHIYQHDA